MVPFVPLGFKVSAASLVVLSYSAMSKNMSVMGAVARKV